MHLSSLYQRRYVGGRALDIAARELGLISRVETVRVDVATIKEECQLARCRKQLNMLGEIGRACERVGAQNEKKRMY
jgi:hypothetical protein